MTWRRLLRPFFSRTFAQFAIVGASGVVVNLGCLWVLSQLGLLASVASAVAIAASVLSNFLVNEYWTFRDHRLDAGSFLGRALRFHLVSLVGASVQWLVFLAANVLWLGVLQGSEALGAYFAGSESAFERYLRRPVTQPPEVGGWIYLSQLAGIAVATAWNFLANFHWTWGRRARGDEALADPADQ